MSAEFCWSSDLLDSSWKLTSSSGSVSRGVSQVKIVGRNKVRRPTKPKDFDRKSSIIKAAQIERFSFRFDRISA